MATATERAAGAEREAQQVADTTRHQVGAAALWERQVVAAETPAHQGVGDYSLM